MVKIKMLDTYSIKILFGDFGGRRRDGSGRRVLGGGRVLVCIIKADLIRQNNCCFNLPSTLFCPSQTSYHLTHLFLRGGGAPPLPRLFPRRRHLRSLFSDPFYGFSTWKTRRAEHDNVLRPLLVQLQYRRTDYI